MHREEARTYLVGAYQLNPGEGDFSLIASMFTRLPKEFGALHSATRLVGYEGVAGATDRMQFFGIEVDSITDIPTGLHIWELSEAEWIVTAKAEGSIRTELRQGISWQWIHRSVGKSSRLIGDFLAQGAEEWWRDGKAGQKKFSIFANVPYNCAIANLRDDRDDVVLSDYNPAWPDGFDKMASYIRDSLGDDIALKVEHFGSTAIPNMVAKPIIDVLIEIPAFDEARQRALSVLNDETWEYWWSSGHMVFIKRKELMGKRTHHLHLAPKGHPVWKGTAFRDYLRANWDDASRYMEFKKMLAESNRTDRERYTNLKTQFVEAINQKAIQGF